jgi:hypothetical protein
MLAGDFLALLIATFGVGVVVYYAKSVTDYEPRMGILVKVLILMIVFLWVGFGILWIG